MTSTSRPSHSQSTSQRSTNVSQSRSIPGSSSVSSSGPSNFFIKERERLITDIADNMEQLLGNVNTLNRKLEESIVVGQEFEPIANLWGPFGDLLTNNGINPTLTNTTTTGTTTNNTQPSDQKQMKHSQSGKDLSDPINAAAAAIDPLSSSFDGPSGNRLPVGVAPGGGTIYGFSSSSSNN